MCRMILNAILIKYAWIVVTLGEILKRDEYLYIAAESGKVGGHAGQLGKLVLVVPWRAWKG
jgi:NADPH-dependent curcumin reductase CurA